LVGGNENDSAAHELSSLFGEELFNLADLIGRHLAKGLFMLLVLM
jgi:hypothetical protein